MPIESKKQPVPYSPSILVIDDNEQVRSLFRRILEEIGYLVWEASSGREALRTIRDRYFDLLILDLSMPDFDGFELMQAIRSEIPGMKVMVTSGFMSGAMLPVAEKLGATATLDKVRAPELLVPLVCRVLQGGSSR